MRSFLSFFLFLFAQFSVLFSQVEVGVVLFPEGHVQEEVIQMNNLIFSEFKNAGFNIKQIPNTPHISIFQINLDEKNLSTLEEKVAYITSQYSTITLTLAPFLRNTRENIFWDVEKNSEGYSELEKLLRDVISKTAYLRHKNPMRQLRDINLTPDEKDLIKKYGVPFGVPENFKPHITVCYDTGDKEIIGDVIKKISLCGKKFSCGRIEIVQLGYSGNIEKVLKSFELKNQ